MEHHELAQLYKAAKVHALVSWMETPGLSSLEAGIMGCNLVVTDRGDTKYYFDDLVEYVEPGNVESIRDGLTRAMEAHIDPSLSRRIAENFTWEHTARQTVSGYEKALEISHR
jgi:glycosyltransferase involved in cell wall biosynthesis